mgnify:CR=1 FL=1
MSQYGMQMPGGQMQRGPTLNIYTGLLALAAAALLAASGYVWIQSAKVSPSGTPWDMQQQGKIEFKK